MFPVKMSVVTNETCQAVDIDLKSIPTPNGQFFSASVASLSSFLPSLNYRLDDRVTGILRKGDEI